MKTKVNLNLEREDLKLILVAVSSRILKIKSDSFLSQTAKNDIISSYVRILDSLNFSLKNG